MTHWCRHSSGSSEPPQLVSTVPVLQWAFRYSPAGCWWMCWRRLGLSMAWSWHRWWAFLGFALSSTGSALLSLSCARLACLPRRAALVPTWGLPCPACFAVPPPPNPPLQWQVRRLVPRGSSAMPSEFACRWRCISALATATRSSYSRLAWRCTPCRWSCGPGCPAKRPRQRWQSAGAWRTSRCAATSGMRFRGSQLFRHLSWCPVWNSCLPFHDCFYDECT
mmetsp:Transcript_13510/g.37420  ORF Transcript_13510/g.37420 Transcript_13510/m.37420 type:complete len:222 (-) Transcript_13510:240-905(-)